MKVANASWGHTKGDQVTLSLFGFRWGEAKALVRRIDATMLKRKWFPEGSDGNSAMGLVIYYQLREPKDINMSPIEAYIKRDVVIPALVEKK